MAITYVPNDGPTSTVEIELPATTQAEDFVVVTFRGCDPLEPMDGWTQIPMPWWKRLWWKLTIGTPVYMAIKVIDDAVPEGLDDE